MDVNTNSHLLDLQRVTLVFLCITLDLQCRREGWGREARDGEERRVSANHSGIVLD